MNTERTFPILLGYRVRDTISELQKAGSYTLVTCIPWAMIQPHAAQADSNHGQTLTRLAERGGLGAIEAIAVLLDQPYHTVSRMRETQAHAILTQKIVDYHKEKQS